MRRRWVLAACAASVLTAAPAQAVEPFVGRWAINPTACTSFGDSAATTPLIATDTNLRWFAGSCRIGKMYKLGQVVYIQARCFGDAAADVPITLDARGDRMRVTWNNAKTEELRRCK